MDVISVNGKRLGFIKDLLVNFNEKKIIGFSIASYSLLKSTLNVSIENVVSFNSVMVITDTIKGDFLGFKNIKGMDLRDRRSNILGMIEDVLFDELSFSINAVVVSTGVITDFISGKEVILIKDIILGEENLLYNGKNEKLHFSSLPHKLFMEDDFNEKNKVKENI